MVGDRLRQLMLAAEGAGELDGEDVLRGHAGNDQIYGEGGNDYLNGGYDDDYLSGGTETDRCYGGPGTDTASASCERTGGIG